MGKSRKFKQQSSSKVEESRPVKPLYEDTDPAQSHQDTSFSSSSPRSQRDSVATPVPVSEFIQRSSETSSSRRSWSPPNSTTHVEETGKDADHVSSPENEPNTGEAHPDSRGEGVQELAVGVDSKPDEAPETVDVFSRLEEIRLSREEPILSEEELRTNNQLQDDELLALEAIYGETMIMHNRTEGLRTFQIYIHNEVPHDYAVSAKLTSSHGRSRGEGKNEFPDNLNELLYNFKVQYLPPIVLTCSLPSSYPSHSCPNFTIYVQWLDPLRISKFCHMLDMLWEECQGQEVLYQWVEWLHSCSFSYLGIDKEVMLASCEPLDNQDMRAISGSVSLEADIPLLLGYSDQKSHEHFLKNIHECHICFSEYAGTEFVRLQCKHYFCQKCMEVYLNIRVTEGNKVFCPEAKCEEVVPPSLLKRLLGDEEFARWESLTLEKTLDSMADVVYCPRCETPCLEDEDNHAQCAKCFFSFCTLCRERRHVGVMCIPPETKLKILQERQNSSHIKEDQKRRELDIINEIKSVKAILLDAKQCPSCKIAISRTEGCNKMTCQNCGQFFCYQCNKAIGGYDHFRGGGCVLFTREEIETWENENNVHVVVAQIQAELFHDHAHRCPICGQLNAKLRSNNQILCWACQNYFCALCRKVVRRGSQHYGPRGCKQHTQD